MLRKIFYYILTAALTAVLLSCATLKHSDMKDDFEHSVKGYNKMIRWHEVESAIIAYTSEELRDDFLKEGESIKQKGVTITDYRIVGTDCRPEDKKGSTIVEFDYYRLPSNRVKTLTDKQKWVYEEKNGGKKWRIESKLPRFD